MIKLAKYFVFATALSLAIPAHAIFCRDLLKSEGGNIFDNYAEKTTTQDRENFKDDLIAVEPHLRPLERKGIQSLFRLLEIEQQNVRLVAMDKEESIQMFLNDMGDRPINIPFRKREFYSAAAASGGLFLTGTALAMSLDAVPNAWPVAAVFALSVPPAWFANFVLQQLQENRFLAGIRRDLCVNKNRLSNEAYIFLARFRTRRALLLYLRKNGAPHFYVAVWG